MLNRSPPFFGKYCKSRIIMRDKFHIPKKENIMTKDLKILTNLLLTPKWEIGNVLNAVFSLNAAGINYAARWDNLLPLVQFAKRQECLCNTLPTGEETEIYHFRSQLDSICRKLEELAADESNENRHFYAKQAKNARALLRDATNEPESLRYITIYQLVIDNWNVLKDWSITFRLLSDLATMEKGWRSTPESRYELVQILNDLSKSWED